MGAWPLALVAAILLAGCSEAPEPELVTVPVTEASASDAEDDHVASNTIDGDPDTRWSAEGRAEGDGNAGPWLVWRLDGSYELHGVELAFYEGDNQNPSIFHLEVSEDGHDWERVLSATASGRTADPEPFAFEPHAATHVRFVGEGRETSEWNSITNARLEGVALAADRDTGTNGQNAAADDRPLPSDPGADADRVVTHGEELRPTDVGVLDPTDLTPSGAVTTTHDGQFITGLDIEVEGRDAFAITVRHDDVVIRDNRLRFPDGAQGIDITPDARGAVVEHNEFDAVQLSALRKGTGSHNNNIGQRAVHVRGSRAQVRRNHFVFVRSGIRAVGDGARIEENYVSGLADADEDSPGGGSLHGTSISVPGDVDDVVIARNRLVAGQSGGIILYAQGGPLTDIEVVDNLVIGRGEGFGLYGGRTHLEQGHFEYNHGVRVEGNRFTGDFAYPEVQGGGTNTAVDLSRPDNTFEGNRWVTGPDDVDARCGITHDECEK
jgi:hypothetical protein